jgi:hypothetical protein
MKRYEINPKLHEVFVQGIGRVTKGRILVGDFDKYVPRLLVEVPDVPKGPPLENTEPRGPRMLTEPAPVYPGMAEDDEEGETGSDGAPVRRPRGRPRKNPLPPLNG